jgi:hypothetical protein
MEAAAQYQGGLRTASDELCTPEAVVLSGLVVASESCLRDPGHAEPEEGQPEAAVQAQAELRMASEKLCMQPPGHTTMQRSEPSANQRLQFKARPN